MKKIIPFIIVFLGLFISCDDDVEINLSDSFKPENQYNFQVDFDGQTFVANYVTASIIDGETIIRAIKSDVNEVIILKLNADTEGAYTLASSSVGAIAYKENSEQTFYTSATNYAGRIDLTTVDLQSKKLFGNFSCEGTRVTPVLDAHGQPVLDVNNNPTYTEETKSFTNGRFTNIPFSTTDLVDSNIENNVFPATNTFFVKLDGEEFVETTLTAQKELIGGVEVIKIKATREGSNHALELQMPADVIYGTTHVLTDATSDPATESTASYKIISLVQEFGAYSGGVTEPVLYVLYHDVNTHRIIGAFEFSAMRVDGSPDTIEFTEGTFSITYTEE